MKYLGLIFTGLLFFMCSCGSDSNTNKNNPDDSDTIKPKFIDSPIAGLNYTCAEKSGITDSEGGYDCDKAPIVFKVGKLSIGTLEKLTEDGFIFPQDILGLERDNFTDPELIALARLLQSLDDDGDIKETITIKKEQSDKFDVAENFDYEKLEDYATKAGVSLESAEQAIKHLKHSYERVKFLNDFLIPLSGGLSGEYYPEWCETTESGTAFYIRYWKLDKSGTGSGKANKSESFATKFSYGLTYALDLEFSYASSDEKKTYTWLTFSDKKAIFTDPDGQYFILHMDKTRDEAIAAGNRHLKAKDCLAD